jgi:hypothetical protein
MALPAENITLKNKEVAFAVLTGEGRQGKKSENEYTLAVVMSDKDRKKFLDKVYAFWEENKPKKAKDPKDDPKKWFSEKDGVTALWASEVVSKKITRKRKPGTNFTLKEFETLGAGSNVDVEIRLFMYDNSFGSGVGMRLSAVQLNEYKKFTGGGGASLEGETIEDDDIVEASDKPKKKKKKKNK